MPLGIVSDSDFESEINNSSTERVVENTIPMEPCAPELTGDVLEMPTPGRHNDVTNIPQSLRKILGEEVAVNGLSSAMKLAESLGGHGISQPTLSTYGRGEISPNKKSSQQEDLLNHISSRKTKISKKALNKINLAMSLMDEQKLLGCDAKELSAIAKDMASVAKSMEPKEREDGKAEPVQFHFYAPQLKQENHYETVTAKDNY